MALADLQAQRAALVAARTSGTLRTTFRSGGTERTVWFKTDTELAAAIAAVDREIAGLSGSRVNTFLPYFPEGY